MSELVKSLFGNKNIKPDNYGKRLPKMDSEYVNRPNMHTMGNPLQQSEITAQWSLSAPRFSSQPQTYQRNLNSNNIFPINQTPKNIFEMRTPVTRMDHYENQSQIQNINKQYNPYQSDRNNFPFNRSQEQAKQKIFQNDVAQPKKFDSFLQTMAEKKQKNNTPINVHQNQNQNQQPNYPKIKQLMRNYTQNAIMPSNQEDAEMKDNISENIVHPIQIENKNEKVNNILPRQQKFPEKPKEETDNKNRTRMKLKTKSHNNNHKESSPSDVPVVYLENEDNEPRKERKKERDRERERERERISKPYAEKQKQSDHVVKAKAKEEPKKIKIDLKKLSELENKRKEMIDQIENKEKVRSVSPSLSIERSRDKKHTSAKHKSLVPKKSKKSSIMKQSGELNENKIIPKSEMIIRNKAHLLAMCSEKEMKDREEQSLLSMFEADPKASYYDEQTKRWIRKVKPEFAIKAFTRPAADIVMNNPENIRPPEILSGTITYILDEIIDIDSNRERAAKFFSQNEITFSDICLFAEDRFRSIRQDFTILDYKGNKDCIESHEKIARFLILCLNECLDYKNIAGDQGLYNLIIKQLNATLTSLREFYEFSDIETLKCSDGDVYVSQNQSEFYSYYILLSIKDTIDAISILNKLPSKIVHSKKLSFTLKILNSILCKDWILFFKYIYLQECDYLTACLMSLYFKDMRSRALHEISLSNTNKNKDAIYTTTFNFLIHLLAFEDEEECSGFLEWYGLDYDAALIDNLDTELKLLKYYPAMEDALVPKKTNRRVIEEKKNERSRKEVINNEGAGFFQTEDEEIKKESDIQLQFQKIPSSAPQSRKNRDEAQSKENESSIDIADAMKISFPDIIKETTSYFQPLRFPEIPEKEEVELFNKIFYQPTPNTNEILALQNEPEKLEIALDKIEKEMSQSVQEIIPQLKRKETEQKPKMKIEEKIKILNDKLTPCLSIYIRKYKKEFWGRLYSQYEKKKEVSRRVQRFIQSRKLKVFLKLKAICTNRKLNRMYIRKLLTWKMEDISLNNCLEYRISEISKKSFFHYYDLRNALIEKFLVKNTQNNLSHTINHLKVIIYTQKKLFISTNVIQDLLEDISSMEDTISSVEFEEGAFFLNINDREIKCNTNTTNTNSSFTISIFFNIVFIDKIGDLPLYVSENQKSMNKFSHCVIFLDYSDVSVMDTLSVILDYSLSKHLKRDVILITPLSISNSPNKLEKMKIGKDLIAKKFNQIEEDKQAYLISSKNDYSSLFRRVIEFYNNREIYNLFLQGIDIQCFAPFQVMNLYSFSLTLKLHTAISQLQGNNFVSEIEEVTDRHWIEFLIQLESMSSGLRLIQYVAKCYYTQANSFLNDLCKVPYEIYKETDEAIMESISLTRDIFYHLYKEFAYIDPLTIIKEEFKKKSFNILQFMQHPRFFPFFSTCLTKISSVILTINEMYSLKVPYYREKTLQLESIAKGEFIDTTATKTGGTSTLEVIVHFYSRFLQFLSQNSNLKIPPQSEKKSYSEKVVPEIKSKTHAKMNELLNIIQGTGLSEYLKADINYSHLFEEQKIICPVQIPESKLLHSKRHRDEAIPPPEQIISQENPKMNRCGITQVRTLSLSYNSEKDMGLNSQKQKRGPRSLSFVPYTISFKQ